MKPKHTYRGIVLSKPLRPAAAGNNGLNTPPRPLAEQRVRVGREVAGRGGKAVSVISGLALDAGALSELATRLKKLCGAGGAVRDGTIEIRGDHRDRLVAELLKLGYQARRSGG
ncbi:MAG TPA: stress response translation initiation inhibitor YciH [Steroidobacteraceae bacterium]